MKKMIGVEMMDIDDIPVGSKFHPPKEIFRVSADDIKKAEKWWKSLPEEQKVKIYQDIQEAIHCWKETIEEKDGKKDGKRQGKREGKA